MDKVNLDSLLRWAQVVLAVLGLSLIPWVVHVGGTLNQQAIELATMRVKLETVQVQLTEIRSDMKAERERPR